MRVLSPNVFIFFLDKKMLEQIRQKLETEQRFRALLENSTDLIIVLDSDWICRYASPSLRRILGFELKEVIGKILFEFVHPEDIAVILPSFEEAAKTTRQRQPLPEYRMQDKSGEWCTFEAVVSNLLDHPAIKGFVLNCHDITERKSSEVALEKAKQVAETANKAKSVFLANISHELRTPLSVIIGYSDMLLEEAEALVDAHFLQDLQQIKSAGTHLLSLINDLLDISKLEAGLIKLHIEAINISVLLKEVVRAVQPALEANKNQLKIELTCPDDYLTSDPAKLRQILINLLNNSAKFTQEGTILLRVEKIEQELPESPLKPAYIIFSVQDTGIGIPPEDLAHLFEPFSQADDSMTRLYGGIGLGLAICRHFIEMMAGKVVVKSNEGIGSEFNVYLPVNVKDYLNIPESEEID